MLRIPHPEIKVLGDKVPTQPARPKKAETREIPDSEEEKGTSKYEGEEGDVNDRFWERAVNMMEAIISDNPPDTKSGNGEFAAFWAAS